jgi:hypothetical protein
MPKNGSCVALQKISFPRSVLLFKRLKIKKKRIKEDKIHKKVV